MADDRGIEFIKKAPKALADTMQQKTDVEYFKRNNMILPQLVSTAVKASYNIEKLNESFSQEDIEQWVNDSIDNLK